MFSNIFLRVNLDHEQFRLPECVTRKAADRDVSKNSLERRQEENSNVPASIDP